jgi:hypothetical protein
MGFIQANPRGDGFIDSATGQRFVPVGVNYAAMLDMVDYQGQPRRFTSLFGVDRETEPDGLAEAAKYLKRLGDLGLNVVRVWTEPQDFFPYGNRLDPQTGERVVDRKQRQLQHSGGRLPLQQYRPRTRPDRPAVPAVGRQLLRHRPRSRPRSGRSQALGRTATSVAVDCWACWGGNSSILLKNPRKLSFRTKLATFHVVRNLWGLAAKVLIDSSLALGMTTVGFFSGIC